MSLSDLRAPTAAEIVVLIRAEEDPGRRDWLLHWYHARNIDRFGAFTADWYRKEYEWLLAHPMAG